MAECEGCLDMVSEQQRRENEAGDLARRVLVQGADALESSRRRPVRLEP